MSQAIASLVHAAQLAQREDTNSSGAAAELPPFSDDYPYPYSSLQHAGFFILFFFPIVALVIVALRVYSRVTTKQFGWDDALICLAMADSLAETVASYFAMRYSFLGVHIYDIPLEADPRIGSLWNYIIQILYNPILALVKTSMLLFLLRLSSQKRSVRYTIIGLNVFNIVLMIAIFVTVIFQCQPISYFWERAGRDPPKDGKCIDTNAFYISTAALTILTDIMFLALPFWIFLGLKMPSRVKVALLFVFALGAVVTVVSILRLLWLIEFAYHLNTQDPTYDIRFTYSAVETNLAIITASAPALRGLFRRWFPNFFASLKSSSMGVYGRSAERTKKPRMGTTTTTTTTTTTGGSTVSEAFKLKSMKGRSEIRSHSPTTSEEEIMTFDGIMRTTEVDVVYADQRTSMLRGTREPVSSPGRTNHGANPYPTTESGMF